MLEDKYEWNINTINWRLRVLLAYLSFLVMTTKLTDWLTDRLTAWLSAQGDNGPPSVSPLTHMAPLGYWPPWADDCSRQNARQNAWQNAQQNARQNTPPDPNPSTKCSNIHKNTWFVHRIFCRNILSKHFVEILNTFCRTFGRNDLSEHFVWAFCRISNRIFRRNM